MKKQANQQGTYTRISVLEPRKYGCMVNVCRCSGYSVVLYVGSTIHLFHHPLHSGSNLVHLHAQHHHEALPSCIPVRVSPHTIHGGLLMHRPACTVFRLKITHQASTVLGEIVKYPHRRKGATDPRGYVCCAERTRACGSGGGHAKPGRYERQWGGRTLLSCNV